MTGVESERVCEVKQYFEHVINYRLQISLFIALVT